MKIYNPIAIRLKVLQALNSCANEDQLKSFEFWFERLQRIYIGTELFNLGFIGLIQMNFMVMRKRIKGRGI